MGEEKKREETRYPKKNELEIESKFSIP